MEKIGAFPQWREHLAFCRLGVAPFADLLNASAQSPAMLTYLDQENSYASKLNENYAREIMELHTLGVHGGYRQADVTSLACVLNGWTLAEEALLLEPGRRRAATQRPAATARASARTCVSCPCSTTARATGLRAGLAPRRSRRALRPGPPRAGNARHAPEHGGPRLPQAGRALRRRSRPPMTWCKDMARVFMESGGDLRPVLRDDGRSPGVLERGAEGGDAVGFRVAEARLCRAAILEIGGDPDRG